MVVIAVVAGIAAAVRVRMTIFHVKISSFFYSEGGSGDDGCSGESKEEESDIFHVKRSCFPRKLRCHYGICNGLMTYLHGEKLLNCHLALLLSFGTDVFLTIMNKLSSSSLLLKHTHTHTDG